MTSIREVEHLGRGGGLALELEGCGAQFVTLDDFIYLVLGGLGR